MSDLARKLQIKDRPVRVLNAPPGFALDAPSPGEGAVAGEGAVDGEGAVKNEGGVLVFVRNRAELEQRAEPALEAARADRLSWIAYPKGGQLGTDLNRDSLWQALEGRGVRPVRQISIDDVWSALRFRPAGDDQ